MYRPTSCADFSSTPDLPSVLVVDDDLGTRETFVWALKARAQVRTAASGAEAIRLARESRFDLLLVDLELGDIRGTEVIRTLHAEQAGVPFVLMSGFLETPHVVEAMKLGALDVLDKPVSIDALPRFVAMVAPRSAIIDSEQSGEAGESPTLLDDLNRFARAAAPGSAAERWAVLVLKGCGAERDPKTLGRWAEAGGVSCTVLTQTCEMVNVRAHDARDFVRVFRALLRAGAESAPVESLLDVGDSRTLRALLEKSGIGRRSKAQRLTAAEFLRDQRLLPGDNFAVRVLSEMVARQTPKNFR